MQERLKCDLETYKALLSCTNRHGSAYMVSKAMNIVTKQSKQNIAPYRAQTNWISEPAQNQEIAFGKGYGAQDEAQVHWFCLTQLRHAWLAVL